MSKIICAHGHSHPTISGAKTCAAVPAATVRVPSAPPAPHRRVVHTSAEPTDRQRAMVASLGGVLDPTATRLEASRIIEALLAAKKSATSPTRRAAMQNSRLGIPMPLIEAIREGRFAVSLDGTDKLHFVRLSVIKPTKSGKFRAHVGHIKVQTQHSDDLIDRCRIAPDGQVTKLSHTMSLETVTQLLLTIITDQKAAAIRYGRALQQCCRCGKTLTDDRSRWYGIGPECENHWPEVIDEVDAEHGVYEPGRLVQA